MKNMALHILDLAQNSARAKATEVNILIREEIDHDKYWLTIEDNGTGMEEEVVQEATNPFFTTRSTRRVGMGLPLIQMNAEQTGGTFRIKSTPGKGTLLTAEFVYGHPDRLPLGEIEDVLVLLAVGLPVIRLCYTHQTPFGTYHFDTEAIRDIIGDIRESNSEVRRFLREMIVENLTAIKAEV